MVFFTICSKKVLSIQLFTQLLLEIDCKDNNFLSYYMKWLGQARFWFKSRSKPRLRGRGCVKRLDSSLWQTNLRVCFGPLPMPSMDKCLTELNTEPWLYHKSHYWAGDKTCYKTRDVTGQALVPGVLGVVARLVKATHKFLTPGA